MKSSVAVFSREDPFPPLPIQKTWYHPSRSQNLTQKKSSKKTSGPGRPSQTADPLSTVEQRQRNGLNRKPGLSCLQTPAEQHPKFQEVWPSTDIESPSTEKTFSSNMDTPGPPVSAGEFSMSSPPQRHQQDSVLAKYVQRFRYGEPSSRAERRPVSPRREEAQPLWWMTPSSPPSGAPPPPPGHLDDMAVLTEDQGHGAPDPLERHGGHGTQTPSRELLDVSALDSDSSLGDLWEAEGVQERASRLLQKSGSSASSGSLVISSEGLGGSDLSSPGSGNEPVRRPFFPGLMESTMYNLSSTSPAVGPHQSSSGPPASASRQRPEEDILFQWRLRRKMEQARQCPRSLSQQFTSLSQPPSAWPSAGLSQPPSAWPSAGLSQPPSAWPSAGLSQPPSAWPSAGLSQPPSAWPSAGLSQPPSAWPSAGLSQPPSAWPSAGLSQPSVSGCVDHMQQQQRIQEPETSRTMEPCVLSVPQLESKGRRCPPAARGPSACSTASAQQVLLCDGSPGPAPPCPPTSQPKAPRRPPAAIAPQPPPPAPRPAASRSPAEAEPRPGPAHWTEEERSVETKRSEDQGPADRQQKRSTRGSAGDGSGRQKASGSRRRPDKMAASTPQRLSHYKDGCQKNSQVRHQDVCSAQHAPSAPSPVQRALRQAVSEVLFPTRGSSAPAPPRCPPPAPLQPTAAHGRTQNPAEEASQLLREAAESDGDEFEEDSLLQVLRQQRSWVKDQISQVDSLLEHLPPEDQAA